MMGSNHRLMLVKLKQLVGHEALDRQPRPRQQQAIFRQLIRIHLTWRLWWKQYVQRTTLSCQKMGEKVNRMINYQQVAAEQRQNMLKLQVHPILTPTREILTTCCGFQSCQT